MASNGVRARPSAAAGLYAAKPAFVARLARLEDLAVRRGTSPDALTVLGAALGVLTGVALVAGMVLPLVWLAVAPLALARMACNAIDGSLARRTGAATPRGAVLNEVGDRVADAVTFAALAPAVGPALALGVVAVALATSFAAMAGHALVGERIGAGPMGKPDRVAVIACAAAAAAFTGPVALTVGAWIVVALGIVTIVRRVRVLWRQAGATA